MFAKNWILGLSTKLKIITAASVLLVAIGGTVAVVALTGDSDTTTDTTSTTKQGQQQADPSMVKSGDTVNKDNDTNAADEQDSEAKEEQTKQSQQTTTNQTNTTTAQSVNPPKQTGATPKPKDQPSVPKADYNLNDGWYFAAISGGGTVNTCWPTAPQTEEEDNECMGAHKNFNAIGVAKSASAAEQSASSKMNQQAEAAHVIMRMGAMNVLGTKLTGSLCSQYGLSCSTW